MSVFLYVLNDVLNTCVLVVTDWFFKSCRLLPLKGLPTAMETAMLLFNKIFRYYGIPEDIVSDRGPQFISKVWKVFFSLLGVTARLSSGYHPQSNGQTERKIQEAGCFLRTFCHGHQNPWIHFLGWAEYAQNSLRQPSTGFTPFQCVYSITSLLYSPGPENHPMFHPSTTGSERARESGTLLTINYSGQCTGARWQQTFKDPKLLINNLDRMSGCQQAISVCACPAGS